MRLNTIFPCGRKLYHTKIYEMHVKFDETCIYIFSKNIVVYYCKCCNLIGYGTRYLFVNRYGVAASNATRPSFSQKNNAYSSFF